MSDVKNENGEHGNAVRSDSEQSNGRQKNAALQGQETMVDLTLRSFRNEAEVYAINRALSKTGGNRKLAAKLLSISYRGLLYKIRQHKIAFLIPHS